MSIKRDLFIVGAGGLGREVHAWAHEVPAAMRDWEVKGFLNSIPSALNGYAVAHSILGDPLYFNYTDNEVLLCAIGDPKGRLTLCRTLIQQGAHFVNLVHPSAIVSPRAWIASGCIVATAAIIGPSARIGSFAIILGSTAIGADVIVEEGATISGFCFVGEKAVIGEEVFLGSHAIVMPGAIVEKGARIGARTVVSGKVPAGATFFGVPGQMIAGF